MKKFLLFIFTLNLFLSSFIFAKEFGLLTSQELEKYNLNEKYSKDREIYIYSIKDPIDFDKKPFNLEIIYNNQKENDNISLNIRFRVDHFSKYIDLEEAVVTINESKMVFKPTGSAYRNYTWNNFWSNRVYSESFNVMVGGSIRIINFLSDLWDDEDTVDLNVKFLGSKGNLYSSFNEKEIKALGKVVQAFLLKFPNKPKISFLSLSFESFLTSQELKKYDFKESFLESHYIFKYEPQNEKSQNENFYFYITYDPNSKQKILVLKVIKNESTSDFKKVLIKINNEEMVFSVPQKGDFLRRYNSTKRNGTYLEIMKISLERGHKLDNERLNFLNKMLSKEIPKVNITLFSEGEETKINLTPKEVKASASVIEIFNFMNETKK